MAEQAIVALDEAIQNIINIQQQKPDKHILDFLKHNSELKDQFEKNHLPNEALSMSVSATLVLSAFNEAINVLYRESTLKTAIEVTLPLQKHVDYLIEKLKKDFSEEKQLPARFLTALSELDHLPEKITFRHDYALLAEGALVGYTAIQNREEMQQFEYIYAQLTKAAHKKNMLERLGDMSGNKNFDSHVFMDNLLNELYKNENKQAGGIHADDLRERLKSASKIEIDGHKMTFQKASDKLENLMIEVSDMTLIKAKLYKKNK